MNRQPVAHLDPRFSSEGAIAASWADALDELRRGDLFWIVTVRDDGQPHVTPLLAIWRDDALYFTTGPGEQKAKNIANNPRCTLVLGSRDSDSGLDVVVHGQAHRVTDESVLRRLTDAYVDKYGPDWRFDVDDGAFRHAAESLRSDDPGVAHVFEVKPTTAFGFGKGETYSQTKWRF